MDTSCREMVVIADLFRSGTLLEYLIAEQVLQRLEAERTRGPQTAHQVVTWISRGGAGEIGSVSQCT
jgi:hypothetical protein